MTVASEVSSVSYAGDGVTLAFSIPFRFLSSSDISVVRRNADLSVTELTTGFSVTGAGGAGGTCTFTAAPAADVDIIISRAPQILQPGDYTSNDAFPAEATETLLDRQTFISQHLDRLVQHCITVPYGDSLAGAGMVLPNAATRANKYLAFGASGALELATLTSSGALTQTIIAELLHPLTGLEASAGATILDQSYAPGDPRRSSFYENVGLRDLGITPIYVDSDTFKVTGDVTSLFPVRTRLATVGLTARNYGQILSANFAAGETTVEMRMEIGNIPADLAAIWVYDLPQLGHFNTFMVDYNASQVMQVVNKNSGASAATQLFVGDFDASGIGIIATKATTVGTYPGGVFYSLAPNNPIAAITTGLPIPLCFVTDDRCRFILAGDGLPSQFTTDLVIQHTNENPNGSSTSKLTIDGTATAYLRMDVDGVEHGTLLVDATRVLFGSFANVPVQFYANGELAASIDVNKNLVAGPAAGAIATTATDGFLYVSSCAGVPTGVPTAKSGMAAVVVDATNHRLYFYDDAWRNAGP